MTVSVHTNTSAMIALQNLTGTNKLLEDSQNRISTGLAVSSAKDNASVYAIAQGQRADLSSLDAVTESLNRASSIADVAMSAGESVSDLLNQLREKVVGAMDGSIDTTSRNALNSDFKSILGQITNVVGNATFNGANILNGSLTNSLSFIANADASSHITLSVRDISLGGSIILVSSAASLSSVTMTCTGSVPASLCGRILETLRAKDIELRELRLGALSATVFLAQKDRTRAITALHELIPQGSGS